MAGLALTSKVISFTSAGRAAYHICGNMMRRKYSARVIPMARAASICACGNAW